MTIKNKNLTLGLAALEDYEEAICQLETVGDTEINQRLKKHSLI